LITLSMIVKNEEATLANCLKSIRDFVDEIIIVDTGSTDGTLALLDDFNRSNRPIRVESFAWCDDFSAARNYALSFVHTPWTLTLDADDIVLNPEILPGLAQAAHKDRATGVWSIYKQDDSCFQRRLQLFKTKQYRWKGIVHESPQPKPGITEDTILSDLKVLHRKPADRCPKAARQYLDILLQKDPDNWLGIAESYKFLACHPDENTSVRECLELADANYYQAYSWDKTNEATKYVCLFNLARLNLDLARFDAKHGFQARAFAQLGVAVEPLRAECWTLLGQANELLGDKELAGRCYTKALQLEPPTDTIGLVFPDYYSKTPARLLEGIKAWADAERTEQAIDDVLMGERLIYTPKR